MILLAIPLMILVIVAISIALTIPVWLVWNWLMPETFGLHALTLFQAWGLTFLCSALFKSTSTSSEKS